MEVCRSCCREVKKGYQRTNSPRYYISTIPQGDEDGEQSEIEEPRVVVQMDTESPGNRRCTCDILRENDWRTSFLLLL